MAGARAPALTTLAAPRRGLLLAAATVALVSLGLPWDQVPRLAGSSTPGVGGGDLSGFETSARVTAVAGAVLLALAIRRRHRALALMAIGVAVLGPFTTGTVGVGQLAYLLALPLAAAGSGLSGRRPLPRR